MFLREFILIHIQWLQAGLFIGRVETTSQVGTSDLPHIALSKHAMETSRLPSSLEMMAAIFNDIDGVIAKGSVVVCLRV